MKYLLYNPLSNNGRGDSAVVEAKEKIGHLDKVQSLIGLDMKEFVAKLAKEDELYICGGDGTLNHFINDLGGVCPENKVYFYSAGTGNDFCKDIGVQKGELVLVNEYLTNLPKAYVNGKKIYFINNVGFGIDGYVCEVADELKKKSSKKINYTMIAAKALLFQFKPRKCKITVDGVTQEFEHVWFSPTLNGRYFGGGMMVSPNQDRKSGLISNVIFHHKNKLKTLITFPKIFDGSHLKCKGMTIVQYGKKMEVEFDVPCALQIDGETYLNIKSYVAEV